MNNSGRLEIATSAIQSVQKPSGRLHSDSTKANRFCSMPEMTKWSATWPWEVRKEATKITREDLQLAFVGCGQEGLMKFVKQDTLYYMHCIRNQKLACFVLCLKIIHTFLKNDIVLKQIVQGTQKGHWNFSRPSHFRVVDQNSQILFWSITQEPLCLLKILMLFLSSLDN